MAEITNEYRIAEDEKDVTHWAAQTVLFAMNIHAKNVGTLKDDQGFIQAMTDEARKIAEELWNKAVSECGKNVPLAQLMLGVSTKVFDWCFNQRNT